MRVKQVTVGTRQIGELLLQLYDGLSLSFDNLLNIMRTVGLLVYSSIHNSISFSHEARRML